MITSSFNIFCTHRQTCTLVSKQSTSTPSFTYAEEDEEWQSCILNHWLAPIYTVLSHHLQRQTWMYVRQTCCTSLPDISHVMQDSRRSTSLSKRLLKCFLHLFTGPSPLFTPPFITCPTARTSDTEIPGLFTKLGRDWQGAKKRKRKNVSLSENGWLQRRQKAPHNVGQWKRQWEELVWMESVRK